MQVRFVIFSLLMGGLTAAANWDPSWLKPAEVQWQGTKPEAKDAVGVSVYCGFANFSHETRVFVSVQNRTPKSICINPAQLMGLTKDEIDKVVKSPRPVRGSVFRAMVKSKLSPEKIFLDSVKVILSYRVLDPLVPLLPDFSTAVQVQEGTKDVEVKSMGVFESSYAFSVPALDLANFEVSAPTDCNGQALESFPKSYRCL